jgi:hypothetical protein
MEYDDAPAGHYRKLSFMIEGAVILIANAEHKNRD